MGFLNDLAERTYRKMEANGFHRDEDTVDRKIALIHSEVSEAYEEWRASADHNLKTYYRLIDGKPEGFAMELADVVIRLADLCGQVGIEDIEAIILEKEAFNDTRPFRHGKQF